MSFLETLPSEKRDLLVRLPYRVGYWVSQSDKIGGAEADALEMQALENIIDGFTRDVFGSETVQYIMMETLDQKRHWYDWQYDLELVLPECRDAVALLAKIVDEKELNSFKLRLMEIGEAVALAFREYDEFPRKESWHFTLNNFGAMIKMLLGIKTGVGDNALNISASERRALAMLKDAVGYRDE